MNEIDLLIAELEAELMFREVEKYFDEVMNAPDQGLQPNAEAPQDHANGQRANAPGPRDLSGRNLY